MKPYLLPANKMSEDQEKKVHQGSCNCCFVITCCGHQFKSRLTRKQTVILVLTLTFAVLLVIIFLIFAIVPVSYVSRKIQPLTTAIPSVISYNKTRVLLYGDSQWGVTDSRKTFLIARIKEFLPEYPMEIVTFGTYYFYIISRFHFK